MINSNTKFCKLEKVSLKNNPEVKEDLIQSFIFDDPTVLGLGNLTSIRREKVQPLGGRLDLLLEDDNETRYEVEIQLGATDPSHIIRTIEYWYTEKKRYPDYDHCAVIIAEEITGRFMNVISLFNGSIPLIAIQMSAYKLEDKIFLTFTRILDRVSIGTEDEDKYEVTDRTYWEKRSSKKILDIMDDIFKEFSTFVSGYSLKYNKEYIGVAKCGITRNFIVFKPKKNFVDIVFRVCLDDSFINKIEDSGLEIMKRLSDKIKIRVYCLDDYKNNKELFDKILKSSMEYLNIED